MELIIHQMCDEDQMNPQEQPIRTQWASEAPTAGQQISMGSDRMFEIAHVYTFEPVGDSPIEAVHVTFSQLPGSDIEMSQWSCWKWKHLSPKENLFVQMEGIGLPDLGCGMNLIDEPPQVGEQLYGGIPTGEGTKLHPVPAPWVIEAYDAYQPIDEVNPYTAVYLNWCKRVAMEPAIAA